MTVKPLLLFISLVLTQSLVCVVEKTSTEKKSSKKINSQSTNFSGCIPKEPEALILLWIAAGFYSHYESVKALIHSSNHGTELQSFYKETPVDVSYELEITLSTRDLTERDIHHQELVYLQIEKTFQNKKPNALIEDAHDFIKKWIQKNQNNEMYIVVSLKPTLITKRGKTATLAPYSFTWNERKGVEQDLRRLFLVSKEEESPTEKTFRAAKYSVYSGLIFYLPLFLFLKCK